MPSKSRSQQRLFQAAAHGAIPAAKKNAQTSRTPRPDPWSYPWPVEQARVRHKKARRRGAWRLHRRLSAIRCPDVPMSPLARRRSVARGARRACRGERRLIRRPRRRRSSGDGGRARRARRAVVLRSNFSPRHAPTAANAGYATYKQQLTSDVVMGSCGRPSGTASSCSLSSWTASTSGCRRPGPSGVAC